jgi:hypothetical protein
LNNFLKKRIHISNLLLDSENPRHEPIDNQPEIIKELIAKEQVVNLAKDIAEQGILSPLELVGVLPVKDRSEYVVIEGNRRVCACILLNNPEMAPTKSIADQFRQFQRINSIPTEIDCTVFESKEDADHWMQLRHEGQQEGIGTKPWEPIQKARYSEKMGRKNPNIQSTKLLEFAVNYGIIDANDKDKYSVTTFGRYLNNPFVRNVFGLQDRESLISNQTASAFEKLVRRFIKDYDEEIVNSRSNKDDWKKYSNILQKEITDPPEPSNPFIDYAVDHEKPAEDSPKKIKRSKPDPAKRNYLLPGDTKFEINDKILNRIYWELRKLPIEGHEFGVAYLFRAFLEGSIYLYLKRYLPEIISVNFQLHERIKKVSEHLKTVQNVKKQRLSSLDIAGNQQNSVLSPLILGSMVHLTVIPYKKELINIWDRMEESLKIIHELLD